MGLTTSAKACQITKTDERWYEAARLLDSPPEPSEESQATSDGTDILAAKGLLPPPSRDSEKVGEPVGRVYRGDGGGAGARVETEDERRERWRADAESMPDLEGKYDLPGHGSALQVTVWIVRGHRLTRG